MVRPDEKPAATHVAGDPFPSKSVISLAPAEDNRRAKPIASQFSSVQFHVGRVRRFGAGHNQHGAPWWWEKRTPGRY
jgi:hypothetical protein